MEITAFVDSYGDDAFALALITTKSFDSAREIYMNICGRCKEFSESSGIFGLVKLVYPLCRKADCNDEAVTLTGVELDSKKQSLLEVVLQKPFIVRSIIHLHWENDLTDEQIAEVLGENVKYVRTVLGELSDPLTESLDKRYKNVCLCISAGDKLKEYAVKKASTVQARQFSVKNDTVPVHKWTKKQKIIICIAAAIIAVVVMIVIPLLDGYINMLTEEFANRLENESNNSSTVYTIEADEFQPNY